MYKINIKFIAQTDIVVSFFVCVDKTVSTTMYRLWSWTFLRTDLLCEVVEWMAVAKRLYVKQNYLLGENDDSIETWIRWSLLKPLQNNF